MGYDFYNLQLFCGNKQQQMQNYLQLLEHVSDFWRDSGYQLTVSEEESDRVVVIGSPTRWVWVYDSAAPDHEMLLSSLANYWSVVSLSVWDDSFLNIFLHRNGKCVDQYCNAPEMYIRGLKRKHPELNYEEADFHGQTSQWVDYLYNPKQRDDLQQVWKNVARPYEILDQMAQLVGWDAKAVRAGYLVYDEGMYEIPFAEFFKMKRYQVDLSKITTFYLQEV